MTKTLVAYHNDPKIKEKYVARVEAHQKADEIEKGYYWENGKGCAVGCTIEGNDHGRYETELGIPAELAFLEDVIFEELPLKRAKLWPKQFLTAITPGTDLTKIVAKFTVWQWEDKKLGLRSLKDISDDDELVKIGNDLAALYTREINNDNPSEDEWYALFKRADAYYNRAWVRVWAGAGAWVRAWVRVWAGAGAGAWVRVWAGAGAGAWVRAWVWAGAGAWAEYDAEYERSIIAMADKLLELLKEAK